MYRYLFIFTLCTLFSLKTWAQPFVDLLSFNSQHFFSNYSDGSKSPLYVQDNFLNLFIPKKFGKDHVFLLRLNAEQLSINRTGIDASSQHLYSLSMPVGFLLTSSNKKWKYTGVLIPKVNSDYKDDLSHDYQLGGIGLVTRVFNEDLQIRAGLYYNREFFGNFFLPLVGVDWKINNRFQMYGTMPSNYRIEYKATRNWNTGLGFRSFTRSFRLNNSYGNDFIWIKESQLKIYLEGFVLKNIIFTIDVYRSIGYQLPRNDYAQPSLKKPGIPALQPFKDNYGFTIGFAYRLLTRQNKNEVK